LKLNIQNSEEKNTSKHWIIIVLERENETIPCRGFVQETAI